MVAEPGSEEREKDILRSGRKGGGRVYGFDKVFEAEEGQEVCALMCVLPCMWAAGRFMHAHLLVGDVPPQAVYEHTAKLLIPGVLEGYNATVFACEP